MSANITLITPPDIYQNDNLSVLFCGLTDSEQDSVTRWLKQQDNNSINIYYYQNEPNVVWLLHSASAADYRYINLENVNSITAHLCGYFLGKENFFYSTNDENTAEIYSHINHNRVKDAVDFLKAVTSNASGTKSQL